MTETKTIKETKNNKLDQDIRIKDLEQKISELETKLNQPLTEFEKQNNSKLTKNQGILTSNLRSRTSTDVPWILVTCLFWLEISMLSNCWFIFICFVSVIFFLYFHID